MQEGPWQAKEPNGGLETDTPCRLHLQRGFLLERGNGKSGEGKGVGNRSTRREERDRKTKGGGAAKPACLPLLRSSRKEWEWMDLVSERGLLGLYTEPYSYNSAGMAMGPWAD